jgi:hypothetical protein
LDTLPFLVVHADVMLEYLFEPCRLVNIIPIELMLIDRVSCDLFRVCVGAIYRQGANLIRVIPHLCELRFGLDYAVATIIAVPYAVASSAQSRQKSRRRQGSPTPFRNGDTPPTLLLEGDWRVFIVDLTCRHRIPPPQRNQRAAAKPPFFVPSPRMPNATIVLLGE